MRESVGDMFAKKPSSAIVVSTNGAVNSKGKAVMGRGCALEAAKRYPDLPLQLGTAIKHRGNRVTKFTMDDDKIIVSFPVKAISEVCAGDKSNVVSHMWKRFTPGKEVPGWACLAQPDLILRSALELVNLTNSQGWEDVICPRFGCGAGEMNWDYIEPMLRDILDDRFIIMTFK